VDSWDHNRYFSMSDSLGRIGRWYWTDSKRQVPNEGTTR
jgi:hypothetical protein